MAIYKSNKITKDGRQYFFRVKYKDITGITHDYTSKKFEKRKDAESEELAFRMKVANKDAYVSNITFEKAFYSLMQEKSKRIKKQTLLKDYTQYEHLSILKDKKINDINLNMYKKLENKLLQENTGVKYKNKSIGLFKQIIIHSNKFYNTSDSILKYVEKFKMVNSIKKEMNFFTYDEYKKFDSVIDDFKYHVFFEILYFLGLRQGELQALIWKDVDLEKGVLKINKTLTTKIKGENWTISSPKTQSSIRELPITKNLLNELKSMFKEVSNYEDFKKDWFVFGNSVPFKETTIQKRKNNYCDLAKVKRIRIHDFRHSCASLLINQGANITLVSKYLGHSNISITLNVYTHLYKNELEKMTDILNNL